MPIKNSLEPKKHFFWIAIIFTIIFTYLFLQSNSSLPKVNINQIDKFVHATFHFIFTLIWFLSFRIRNVENLKKAVAISILYGILIEILQQLLTTTRQADVFDLLANITGSIIAVYSLNHWLKHKK